MDIYQRLTKDHEIQKNLAAELMETSGDSPERRSLFDKFKSEVESHAAAEEQTFYAELIETAEGQEQARHSIAEHKEAADLIEELTELEMSTGGWIQKFEKLKEELEHHIEEEEKDVFQLARKCLDPNIAEQLTEKFNHRKSEEKS